MLAAFVVAGVVVYVVMGAVVVVVVVVTGPGRVVVIDIVTSFVVASCSCIVRCAAATIDRTTTSARCDVSRAAAAST